MKPAYCPPPAPDLQIMVRIHPTQTKKQSSFKIFIQILFQDPLPIDKHQKLYGYNFEKITYPFKNDPQFQLKWLDRLRGNYNFPAELIAEYNEDFKCKHGISFNSSDENLYRESVNFVLYSELIETVFYIPVFGRRSLGPCLCLQRVDGTKYLIRNFGQGRFANFTLLHSYLHK